MKAISKKMKLGDAAVKSVLAGADVVLITTYGKNIKKIFEAIKNAVVKGIIPIKRIDESVKRILELKFRYNIMSNINKRIEIGSVEYNEKEKKMLETAEHVNREISKRAIYYQGDKKLLSPEEGALRIFLTQDKKFKGRIKLDENDIILSSPRLLFRKNLNKNKSHNKILYYHIYKLKPNIKRLKLINRILLY